MIKNKFLFLLVCLPLFLLTSCKVGNTALSTGLADQGFLELTAASRHADVLVELENGKIFKAKVNRINSKTVKGYRYAIATGKRTIKIYDEDGKQLYTRTLLVSTQQVKTIQLP